MSEDDVELSAVAADAALLDALAAGAAGTADDDALTGLAALRTALDDDLALTTAPALQAAPVGDVVALRRPTGRRAGGRAAALVAGAALALSSTGVAAATYDARPGDAFYGLRTAVAGPRAEDPELLRERLDAVRRQLRSPDETTRSSARAELAEVAALLSELQPGLRGDLERRHAALMERLADSAPDGPPADAPPTGPPAGAPKDEPTQGRTPDARPEPTRTPSSTPPTQRPSATPAPAENRPSSQSVRPSPRASTSPPEQRPSPRRSQAAPSSGASSSSAGAGKPGRPSLTPSDELTAPS